MAIFIAKNEIILSLTTRWRTKKILKNRAVIEHWSNEEKNAAVN